MRALPVLASLLLISCHPRPDTRRHKDADLAMYTVAWGDRLEWIAWDFDVAGGYPALAKLNGIRDPDHIRMGQRLRIPRNGAMTEGLPPWPGMEPVADGPRACHAERLEPPRTAVLPGCATAACVPLDGGWQRICSCEATQGTPGFVLVEGGRPVIAWPAPVGSDPGDPPYQIMGTARDFDVVKADLNGDGRREYVVAFRRELNDVGMSHWNMAVLDGAHPQAPPLLFTAANYGEGSLVRSPDGGCDLLSTTWELAWEPPKTNPGWTLLGRPMAYRGGALEPLRDEPIFARRLYYSFEPGSLPLPGGLVVGTPAKDLGHHKAVERWVEPATQLWRHGESAVAIAAVHPSLDPELGVVTDLELERDGHRWRLGYRDWSQGYEGIGDAHSGRLYPPGYRPGDPDWLQGRGAKLASYARIYGDSLQLIWLER